jgi:iron complex outermembrane recepter protein
LIGTAVAMALFGRNGAVQADAASGDQTASNQAALQEVTVTGIRASLEQSIDAKRAATNVVDVVTAEDIGKLPDKNVADALQRIPGVTISSAGANEGGFDEADRVSMRGTNPSLTQTLINGHSVASGDWFVLDQTGTVGRSVSYTLLPAEVVGKVVVTKSSEAELVEGGVAGTVDIITRRPLDFHEQTTLQASAGAVYADLPDTVDPQFSALGNWVNDDRTFGMLAQVFAENRHLERQGQELLGYSQFAPTSNMVQAHPDLANVWYPDLIGSALFQQKRERTGGMIDVQWAPNDQWNIDASGFTSKLDATNLNDNYLLWGNNFINGGTGQLPSVPAGSTLAATCAANPGKYNGCAPGLGLLPGYVVKGNTLAYANWAAFSNTFYGVYDQISRPDESASTSFVNLDVHLKATDQLLFLGQVGVSDGHGKTPNQDVSETLPGAGAGAHYQLNGVTTAANWNLGSTLNTTPTPGGTPVPFSWIFGDQNLDVVDREVWAKIDGDFKADIGPFKDFLFGGRYAKHDRNLWGVIGQGPNANGENTGNYPTGYQNYPTDFGSGLGAGFPTGIWYWTPAQLAAYNLPGDQPRPGHARGLDLGLRTG